MGVVWPVAEALERFQRAARAIILHMRAKRQEGRFWSNARVLSCASVKKKAACLAFYALLELVKRLKMARFYGILNCFSLSSEAFRCSPRWRT